MENKLPFINPLLHNELRLKIMVTLDSLDSADFVYLSRITESTRGNLSVQITNLKEAGYLEVTKTGIGPLSHTVCRISKRGREALSAYEAALKQLFARNIKTEEESHEMAVS